MLLWASFGLHWLMPLQLPLDDHAVGIGRVLTVAAGALLVWAQHCLREHKTTADHSRPSTQLVTAGPYRYSRNPIYLAMIGVFLGLALVFRNGWAVIMIVPFVVAVGRLTIDREERYLHRLFGEEYARYKRRVRRWV